MTSVKRLLIAEDNPALAGVIGFNLQRVGYEVTIACNGQEAWEFAQSAGFDLVVTDQQMPLMTGVELIERLRAKAEYASVPMIMLTAKGLELDLVQLREELGIEVVMAKPFSPFELVEKVSDCLTVRAGC